jgi:hypothetical protein
VVKTVLKRASTKVKEIVVKIVVNFVKKIAKAKLKAS